MKHRNNIGIVLASITCAYGLLYTGDGWAQEEITNNLEKRGRAALNSKQYSTARELFS